MGSISAKPQPGFAARSQSKKAQPNVAAGKFTSAFLVEYSREPYVTIRR
jgi:hypothetical protein